jgi:hypothetical protein
LTDWIIANKRNPCPICEKTDWCTVSSDGNVAHCMRVQEGSFKECQGGGWIHKLTDAQPRYVPKKRKVYKDFRVIWRDIRKNPIDYKLLSKELGVSEVSLARLHLCWDGSVFCFPMRNIYYKIIGISRRTKPKPCCIKGSSIGIFWPLKVTPHHRTRLFICEGPTDCAALLDLGFDAIGRQGCLGCVDIIQKFLTYARRDIVIMADHDSPKNRPDGSQFRPGQEGALRLGKAIISLCASVCIITPPNSKDIRQWYNEGATKEMVEALIKNARYMRK